MSRTLGSRTVPSRSSDGKHTAATVVTRLSRALLYPRHSQQLFATAPRRAAGARSAGFPTDRGHHRATAPRTSSSLKRHRQRRRPQAVAALPFADPRRGTSSRRQALRGLSSKEKIVVFLLGMYIHHSSIIRQQQTSPHKRRVRLQMIWTLLRTFLDATSSTALIAVRMSKDALLTYTFLTLTG